MFVSYLRSSNGHSVRGLVSHDEQRLFSDLSLESHVVEEENKVAEGGTEITKHPSHSCKDKIVK